LRIKQLFWKDVYTVFPRNYDNKSFPHPIPPAQPPTRTHTQGKACGRAVSAITERRILREKGLLKELRVVNRPVL
jgi:hypothetical protein